MRWMNRMLIVLLVCCLLPISAGAEDVCTVGDASAEKQVTTACPYLQVRCPLPGEVPVTLSVHDEWGYLIYQRDYGLCSGTFRSRDVHLPLNGDLCRYIVTLQAGDEVHSFTVVREAPLLTDSAVYAGGLTLRELNGGSRSKYAVVLDLYEMEGRTRVVPMIAGDMQIGEVFYTVEKGVLTVSASLLVQGQIDKANVSIATDALTAQSLGANRFSGTKLRLDQPIDLSGLPYAAVMVQFTVTYDSSGAFPVPYGREEEKQLEQLRQLWQLMQLTTLNEAVG